MGVTSVTPSDKLLFAYYIDGILKNISIEQRLNNFITEIRAKQLSIEFLTFIKKTFDLEEADANKLVAPYRKFF